MPNLSKSAARYWRRKNAKRGQSRQHQSASGKPIELVRSLIPHLRAYRGLATETTHYRAPVEGREVNSPSFTIRLGAHVALRLYAKTNRRIRFEIIHEKINHRELLGEPQTSHRNRPVPMPRPWEQIFHCLAAIRTQAAAELNGVLQFLSQRTRVEPSNISGFSLLIKIVAAVEDAALATTIVSLLLDGAIAARNAGEELLRACRRLADAGVFAHDNARCVYDVTAPYARALDNLRSVPKG